MNYWEIIGAYDHLQSEDDHKKYGRFYNRCLWCGCAMPMEEVEGGFRYYSNFDTEECRQEYVDNNSRDYSDFYVRTKNYRGS